MEIRFYCDGPTAPPRPGAVHGGVGVYLHGQAEVEAGFDVPDTNIDLATVPDGTHAVWVNDQPGYILALWRSSQGPLRLRGLVVKDTDAEGLSWAQAKRQAGAMFL
jgi:hypothetical protein